MAELPKEKPEAGSAFFVSATGGGGEIYDSEIT